MNITVTNVNEAPAITGDLDSNEGDAEANFEVSFAKRVSL